MERNMDVGAEGMVTGVWMEVVEIVHPGLKQHSILLRRGYRNNITAYNYHRLKQCHCVIEKAKFVLIPR